MGKWHKHNKTSHKREPRGQPFPNRWPQGCKKQASQYGQDNANNKCDPQKKQRTGTVSKSDTNLVDWPQSLKQFFINVSYHIRVVASQISMALFRLAPVLTTIFINVSYHILVASLILMALFKNRAVRVILATTSIWYDTLMKNCFKDWSQSTNLVTYTMMISYGMPLYSVIRKTSVH